MGFRTFFEDDSGAVTVDWVVLTAGMVGLGLATIAVASGGIENLSGDIGQELANIDVGGQFSDWISTGGQGWGDFALLNTLGFDQAHFEEYATRFGTDEAAILNQYDTAYRGLVDGNWIDQGDAIDAFGAAEAALIEYGYELPDGYPSYEELYNQYAG